MSDTKVRRVTINKAREGEFTETWFINDAISGKKLIEATLTKGSDECNEYNEWFNSGSLLILDESEALFQ